MTEIMDFVCKEYKAILEKGENAGNQHFFPSSHNTFKVSSSSVL